MDDLYITFCLCSESPILKKMWRCWVFFGPGRDLVVINKAEIKVVFQSRSPLKAERQRQEAFMD